MSQPPMLSKPRSALVTAEELWRDWSGVRCELVRGEVIPSSPTSGPHGRVRTGIAYWLSRYLEEHPIGFAYTGDAGLILSRDPDTVRAPDAAFLTAERAERELDEDFIPFAPDLAVEVVSPSDTYSEVASKVEDWLAAGTRLVWVVDPKRRTVQVCAPLAAPVTLQAADTLTGGEVLPGFSVPVEELFGRSPRPAGGPHHPSEPAQPA